MIHDENNFRSGIRSLDNADILAEKRRRSAVRDPSPAREFPKRGNFRPGPRRSAPVIFTRQMQTSRPAASNSSARPRIRPRVPRFNRASPNSTARPANPTARPVNPTMRPANTTARPANSTARPANSTARPANPTARNPVGELIPYQRAELPSSKSAAGNAPTRVTDVSSIRMPAAKSGGESRLTDMRSAVSDRNGKKKQEPVHESEGGNAVLSIHQVDHLHRSRSSSCRSFCRSS